LGENSGDIAFNNSKDIQYHMSNYVYDLTIGVDPRLDYAFFDEPRVSADEPQLPEIDYAQLVAIACRMEKAKGR
jgi:hypothetical protein